MTETCDHYWLPTDPDASGQPVFVPNRQLSPEPLTHAECKHCGIRTWFTEKQWWAIPARSEDLP